MKISDKERLKKIVKTWASLQKQMDEHNITRELLLDDEFSQWAITTPGATCWLLLFQLAESS